jgi:hypothetical protein
MAPVAWMIIFLTLPALAVGDNNESFTIPMQSVAQVVKEIYQQLHSKFVILLYEFFRNEGRKYIVSCSVLVESFVFYVTVHYSKSQGTPTKKSVRMVWPTFELGIYTIEV